MLSAGCLHVEPRHYDDVMMRQLVSNSHTVKSVRHRQIAQGSHTETDRQYHPLTACTSTYRETLLIIPHAAASFKHKLRSDLLIVFLI